MKHDGSSIRLWRQFSAAGPGRVVRGGGGGTNAPEYAEIHPTEKKNSSRNLHHGRRCAFLQDNDPKHITKNTDKWLQNNNFSILEWPSQSPDLNPMENLMFWKYVREDMQTIQIALSDFPSLPLVKMYITSEGLTRGESNESKNCSSKSTRDAEEIVEPTAIMMLETVPNNTSLYVCTQCGKKFTTKRKLEQHEKNHSRQKLYKCTRCGRKFTSKFFLQRHEWLHAREKTYSCTKCTMTFFIDKVSLDYHQKGHIKTSNRCTECGKGFTNKYSLKRHSMVHTGERPHICSECGKNFVRRQHLQIHQRIHTGEKPYCCSKCGMKFAWKHQFQNHDIFHTGTYTF
uniref:C2H2-type domain-containing protein n=1 Tax=Erpetoichthys calabaricus TaxID=27687 RepID=A0A8C4RIU2_ERPCA